VRLAAFALSDGEAYQPGLAGCSRRSRYCKTPMRRYALEIAYGLGLGLDALRYSGWASTILYELTTAVLDSRPPERIFYTAARLLIRPQALAPYRATRSLDVADIEGLAAVTHVHGPAARARQ
jgi:hypothetical protein